MKTSIKCTCGLGNGLFCPNCSKLKMTILLKNGCDHLKLSRNGNFYNPVWYSHLKYNNYDDNRIIEKMEKRLRENILYGPTTNVIQFYENDNRNQFIRKITL